jgi:hypothetical protein
MVDGKIWYSQPGSTNPQFGITATWSSIAQEIAKIGDERINQLKDLLQEAGS